MRTHEYEKLLRSDKFAYYSLRSTFFARELRGPCLGEAIREVTQLAAVPDSFDWTSRQQSGIDETARECVLTEPIRPVMVFCRPRILAERPHLQLYDRTADMLSQKGLQALVGGNVAKIERGRAQLGPDGVRADTVVLNGVISVAVRTVAEPRQRNGPGFQFAPAGTTILGSWNNAMGEEGKRNVQMILLNRPCDEMLQVVWKDSTRMVYARQEHATLLDRLSEVRVVRLRSGFHLVFGSQPDISQRDEKGVPQLAIEVKAGADPAGALKRLGAMMKSFDNDRGLNPRVRTVLVVRTATRELHRRIREGGLCDHRFALGERLADDKTQTRFANLVLRIVLKK